jgi:hypothetical protein
VIGDAQFSGTSPFFLSSLSRFRHANLRVLQGTVLHLAMKLKAFSKFIFRWLAAFAKR